MGDDVMFEARGRVASRLSHILGAGVVAGIVVIGSGAAYAKNDCDRANNGMYDRTAGQGTVDYSISGSPGQKWLFGLRGNVTNSLAIMGTTTVLSGQTSGTKSFTFRRREALFLMRLDVQGGANARLQVRCQDNSGGGGNNGGNNNGGGSSSLQMLRDLSVANTLQLSNGLFTPGFGVSQATNFLMGQSALQANILGMIRKYLWLEDIWYDIDDEYHALEAQRDLEPDPMERAILQQRMDRLDDQLASLDFKLWTLEGALVAQGVTEDDIDQVALNDFDSSHFGITQGLFDSGTPQRAPEKHVDIFSSFMTEPRTFGTTGRIRFYAPNPVTRTDGPLAAFSQFDEQGARMHETLIDTPTLTAWAEAGLVTDLGNGNRGQWGLSGGLKVGAATLLSKQIALAGELFAADGTFGITGASLSGSFTQFGGAVTPVFKLADNLFLSLAGNASLANISQNRAGVTANYNAFTYGIEAKLAGSFWASLFFIEPDASVSWDHVMAPGVTASNGKKIPALSANNFKVSAGGRLSAAVIPTIWGLPQITPYLTGHLNWLQNGVGGAAYSGVTADIGGGVTAPLGGTGAFTLGLTVNNLFLPAGSNIAGTAGVQGTF